MRSFSKILSLALTIALFPSFALAQELHADRIADEGRTGAIPAPSEDDVLDVIGFQTEAKQAILVDFNSSSVLYDRSSEEKMFPSSMTKVLTMYLVFDQLKKGHITLDTEFTVSEKSWKTGGSQMFLKVGDKVKVDDLIQGVTVQSGNDACIALAEGISGSVENFVEDMNIIAKQIGMENTHFVNPDGLPTEGHYTTAKDLATIARRMITDFPEYYHYYSQREFTYGGITQHNRNKLLDKEGLGVDGMKTGYTELGGYGMIATGVNDDRRLIAVVNGLPSENARLKAAEELLRYGYNSFKSVKLFNKGDIIDKIKIWSGEQDSVAVAPEGDVEILISRKDYNKKNYKIEVAYKEPWIAPIKKGDVMASLIVKNSEGKVIQQYPLNAVNDVAEAGIIKKITQKAKYLLGKW